VHPQYRYRFREHYSASVRIKFLSEWGAKRSHRSSQGMATNCEKTPKEMEERYEDCLGLYHRLNVEQRLAEISLEKWEQLSDVTTYTGGISTASAG
jgi:hypothetical protein